MLNDVGEAAGMKSVSVIHREAAPPLRLRPVIACSRGGLELSLRRDGMSPAAAAQRDDDRIMWRCLAIAAMLYGFGHPGLEPYRPAAFDRSLREFHRDVNRLAAHGVGIATAVDQTRTLRHLSSLSAQFQAMLTGH
jgi:hypothetical protein